MPQQFAIEERKTALARVLHNLHKALELVHEAQYINRTHALDVELPLDKPLTDAINSVVQTYQQPVGVAREG